MIKGIVKATLFVQLKSRKKNNAQESLSGFTPLFCNEALKRKNFGEVQKAKGCQKISFFKPMIWPNPILDFLACNSQS